MRRTHCATKPSFEPLKMKLSLRALGNILWMTRTCISVGIWSSTTLSLLRSSDVEYLRGRGLCHNFVDILMTRPELTGVQDAVSRV